MFVCIAYGPTGGCEHLRSNLSGLCSPLNAIEFLFLLTYWHQACAHGGFSANGVSDIGLIFFKLFY